MSLRRRPASNPTVVSRSRSPRIRTARADRVVHSFLHFNSDGFVMVALLADRKVKAEQGPKHGSWERGEDGEYIIEWHHGGIPSEVRRHRYAKNRCTQAWQLMEREGDRNLVDNVTFLFPVAQGETPEPVDFLQHKHQSGLSDFKLMELQEDKLVIFHEGLPHGSWRRQKYGDLVINYLSNEDEAQIKNHRYHKTPYTHVWRLLSCNGFFVQGVTLLLPISDH